MTGAAVPPPAARKPLIAPVLEKAHAVAAQAHGLKVLAHEAQVREALTRTELTLALHEALAARAELVAKLRERSLAA